MRTSQINNDTLGIEATVVYPDAVAYAFNPNYVEISSAAGVTSLLVSASFGVTSYELTVNLYNGEARCYISKLLQVFFDDYVSVRSKEIAVSIKTEDGTSLFDFDILTVWGVLEMGKRYGYYLPFVYDRGFVPKQIRNVIWFKNLPFKLSLFRESDDFAMYTVADKKTKTDIDASNADVGIMEYNPNDICPTAEKELVFVVMKKTATTNAFDADFDIVFDELSQIAYIVRLTVCDDTAGIYLRWIDQYGFWQYYLFVKGERASKNKADSNTIDAEYNDGGVYFNAVRNLTVANTDTISCAAVNLDEETLAYVETIYKSPHVEMYVGKDYNGNELWQPVTLDDGTTKIAADRILRDYEITISMQETSTQTL